MSSGTSSSSRTTRNASSSTSTPVGCSANSNRRNAAELSQQLCRPPADENGWARLLGSVQEVGTCKIWPELVLVATADDRQFSWARGESAMSCAAAMALVTPDRSMRCRCCAHCAAWTCSSHSPGLDSAGREVDDVRAAQVSELGDQAVFHADVDGLPACLSPVAENHAVSSFWSTGTLRPTSWPITSVVGVTADKRFRR